MFVIPDRVIATGFGALHDRHPLVIIAEEGEVEVGTAAVRLSADWELAKQSPHSLCVPTILGIHNSVLESEADTQTV